MTKRKSLLGKFNSIAVRFDDRGGEYFHVEANFSTGLKRDLSNRLRPDYGDSINPDETIARFVISAQGGGLPSTYEQSYAWKASFRDDFRGFKLDDLKHMTMVLNTLKRGKEKYHETFGYPETFGAYITMICSIFNLETVILKRFDGNEYGHYVPGKAKRVIDDWIREQNEKRHPSYNAA